MVRSIVIFIVEPTLIVSRLHTRKKRREENKARLDIYRGDGANASVVELDGVVFHIAVGVDARDEHYLFGVGALAD